MSSFTTFCRGGTAVLPAGQSFIGNGLQRGTEKINYLAVFPQAYVFSSGLTLSNVETFSEDCILNVT